MMRMRLRMTKKKKEMLRDKWNNKIRTKIIKMIAMTLEMMSRLFKEIKLSRTMLIIKNKWTN